MHLAGHHVLPGCVDRCLQRLSGGGLDMRMREPAQPDRQAPHQPERRIDLLRILTLNVGPVVRLRPGRLPDEVGDTQPVGDTGFRSHFRIDRVPLREIDFPQPVHVDRTMRDQPCPRVEQPHALQHPLRPRVRRQQQAHVSPPEPAHQVLPRPSGE